MRASPHTRTVSSYASPVLTQNELEEALLSDREGRSFELKGPGASSDSRFMAKVARAVLSMGNLRDGGHVIVGIDDDTPSNMLPGLAHEDLASWSYDGVAARLAVYCDPPLSFDLAPVTLATGATVVVIAVDQFAEVPHLCAKEYDGVLRKGALYVRSRRMPETAEIAASLEMRELLDLAAETRLREYVETAERAGVQLVTGSPAERKSQDDARFASQLDKAWQ
jgi:predicted HTH transcriptional regulator